MTFTIYKTISVLIYLLLSTVMLYHRRVQRWVRFSISFFCLYAVAAYLFFRQLELPVNPDALKAAPAVMFTVGAIACIGLCLIKQLSFGQSLGVTLCYFCAVFTILAATVLTSAEAKSWIALAAIIATVAGVPVILGLNRIRHPYEPERRRGSLQLFLTGMTVLLSLIGLTIGFEGAWELVEASTVFPELNN